MIISFAFSLIGAILVLANFRPLRKTTVYLVALFVTILLAAAGIYFILDVPKETDRRLFFPLFTPFIALILMQFTRWLYKLQNGREIIFHLHGLFPVRQDERYVTSREKFITFILLLGTIIIPFLLLFVLL